MAQKFKITNLEIESVETATLEYQYNDAKVEITDGLTVEQAFRSASGELGFPVGRVTTFRCNGNAVAGSSPVKAGARYTATVSQEDKGAL